MLDEATANVDFNTDKILQLALFKTFANCTVFLITHRLSNVKDMDKLIYLNNGKANVEVSIHLINNFKS